jgi:hypothetical protein
MKTSFDHLVGDGVIADSTGLLSRKKSIECLLGFRQTVPEETAPYRIQFEKNIIKKQEGFPSGGDGVEPGLSHSENQ